MALSDVNSFNVPVVSIVTNTHCPYNYGELTLIVLEILSFLTFRGGPFGDCSTTITSSLLKFWNLYTIPCGLYGSPNAQNWMCELCMYPVT